MQRLRRLIDETSLVGNAIQKIDETDEVENDYVLELLEFSSADIKLNDA